MSSTDSRRVHILAAIVVVVAGFSSVGFTSRAHPQRDAIQEASTMASPTLEVAVLAAAFAAYGWAANKLYDLGKEVGRARAESGGRGKELVHLDKRHEPLLD